MKIGIIGGSGLYEIEGIEGVKLIDIKTPFGSPSDAYVCGRLSGREVFFLPRHARGHRILPAEINHKANIYGFKTLGVEHIVSISAVGSLKQELRPRDVILPDQYFDRTKGSLNHTFFGNGIVAHISFGEPACAQLRRIIATMARKLVAADRGRNKIRVNVGGTYVNMEGPAFSTKAESNTYRRMGFDVIGMTSLPEAKLCREAEICYQSVAMVTDYDCWHANEDDVSVEMIIGHLTANVALAKQLIKAVVPALPEKRECGCSQALKNAILTNLAVVPEATKQSLRPIIGKYL